MSSQLLAGVVKLTSNETKYGKKAFKYLLIESGAAVQELKLATLAFIESSMEAHLKSSIDRFNPMRSDTAEIFGESPRESAVEKIKEVLSQALQGEGCGKKLWAQYGNLKSEFRNHWRPHYKMSSGQNEDDAFENVRKHVWAHRMNKGIKKPSKAGKI